MKEGDGHRGRAATWLTAAAIVLLCLPTLVFSYLPMTDVPQHLAVASVLQHVGDPAYGFADHYAVDWLRTPYVVPYMLLLSFGKLMGLQAAGNVVAFLSVLAYPLGLLALIRASGKPAWLALLAMPLVYNRAFFWGFLNFNLSVGLALVAFAFWVSPRKSPARDAAQAAAVLLTTFTHVYGLALIVALVATYSLCGGWPAVRARLWTLVPVVLGIAAWALGARSQAGYGTVIDPELWFRIITFHRGVLGGYQDRSEGIVLLLGAAAWLLLAWPALPITRARMRALSPLEAVAVLALLGNIALYLALPQATPTAKFIHFRHAFLACALMPLLARDVASERLTFAGRALPVVLAVAAIANAWGHLALFHREARRFDEILAVMPPRPRIVSMVFDPHGSIMDTSPYLHFAAYIQAEKGGLISTSFPLVFWNLPVAGVAGDTRPPTPVDFEWRPQSFDEAAFGYFYDYALIRIPGTRHFAPSAQFPFELVAAAPPWQLYKRSR